VVLGNGHPFDSCPMSLVRIYRCNGLFEAGSYQAACLRKRVSQPPKTYLECTSTHSCNKDALRKSKLRHSGQRYHICSKHDERATTWRLVDGSAEFHRQHNRSQMRRPRWPSPGRFSCIGAAAHLLVRIVATPQLSWPAFFLRSGAVLLDLKPRIIKIALHDQHSSGCRMLHGSCVT
jgi:hypothetical protein